MTASPPEVDIWIHPKFQPLRRIKHTYANIFGGRGGMKSTQVQLIALLEAIAKPMRICEARETMSSMRDSSHKLLSDLIFEHKMAVSQNGPYEIQADRIIRREGDRVMSEFIFVGVRENVRDQKSLAKINLTIFEEAAKASQDSLDVFIPTVIREAGSRAWFIWNPELVTDPTYKWLMLTPPSNTIHIETSYLDNPWLSEEMRNLAEDCKRDFPLKYEHIWLGKPNMDVQGAIFEAELKLATEQGRICRVPYNRTRPVFTAWDLGFNDPTAIWFYQAYDGQFFFIDYFEGNERTIADYLIVLQNRGYVYETDWLPWDAVSGRTHSRLTADKTTSPDQMMRAAGRKVRIAPDLGVNARINFARTLFSQCKFDEEACKQGIQQLRRFQWEPANAKGIVSGKELHNEASHAGTAFCCAAVGAKQPKIEEPKKTPVRYQPPIAGEWGS